MDHLELIGAGREADVYALDERRVLRRYREGADAGYEAAIMIHLAGLGFPVPRIFEVSGADMILERLDGPTMIAALGAGRLTVDEGAAILAALHHRLHELPARISRRPGDRILHRDLHPDNIMLTGRGPVVIDWHNATEGRPAVDVALTAVILAQVAADPGHPHAAGATAFLTSFLRTAAAAEESAAVGEPAAAEDSAAVGEPAAAGGLIGTQVLAGLDESIEVRRFDPALSPAESAGLAATVGPLIRSLVTDQPIRTTRAQGGAAPGS